MASKKWWLVGIAVFACVTLATRADDEDLGMEEDADEFDSDMYDSDYGTAAQHPPLLT